MNQHSPITRFPRSPGLNGLSRGSGLWVRILVSNRFVLGGALLLAIVLPELLHAYFAHICDWCVVVKGIEPARLMSTMAIIAGHISLRKFGVLPRIEAKALVLPTFLATYGVAIALVYVTQENVGRYHFVTSFVLVLIWYYALAFERARILRPRMVFVSSRPPENPFFDSRIEWIVPEEPSLPPNISGMVVDFDPPLSREWEAIISKAVLAGVPVYERAHLEESLSGRVRMRKLSENIFGSLLPSFLYLRLKRLLDLLAAVMLLPLFVPVIAIAGLIVRLDGGGPMFFLQRRIGYRGESFICYKLRTMRPGASGPSYTVDADPRVTRVGRFLRRTRIDELPQIFNIIKGDMSWIGPRPEAEDLARGYEKLVPFYAYRHAVRPGITGWAAVHQGNVASTGAAMVKLEYDFFYIKYFSPWLDILIILKTIQVVVTGAGSR